MELEELIRELDNLLGEADIAADGGDEDEAREQLREMKELLEIELVA